MGSALAKMVRKIQILLIEDDSDDVDLLQESLSDNGVVYDMKVIKEGGAAINHFKNDGHDLPDIIIMDFNLPKVHGRDIIREIRANPRYGKIPVLILSTSSASNDIDYAHQMGADSYLTKPATLEAINETVKTIIDLATKKQGTA